jgi:hypothetical protein
MSDPAATSGERENASELLQTLLKKYSLTEKDLLSEETDVIKFDVSDEYERKLLVQIVCQVVGVGKITCWSRNPYSGRTAKNHMWFELTKVQSKEVTTLYTHYRKDLQKGLMKFFKAFVQANKIFPAEADNAESAMLSPDEIQELLEILALTKSIKPNPLPQKYSLLEDGKNE